MLQRIQHFIAEALWRINLADLPLWKRLFVHPLRFLLLTIKTYVRDGSTLHASALTYITLLAIVPVLALGLTTLNAFGVGDLAQTKIIAYIDTIAEQVESSPAASPALTTPDATPAAAPQTTSTFLPQVGDSGDVLADELRRLTNTVFEQIDAINFAKIGIIGAIFLIFMVISVLGKIEYSFNMIWGIRKPRPLWRKCTDYLSVIIVVPMLLLAATSFPILDTINDVNPHAGAFVSFIADLGLMKFIIPLAIGTTLFAFLFGFLPNTRVKISSCFLGGFFTIIILSIFFKICMVLQVGIANNSMVYGSLIALPILLFWILSSWLIILFGAEICYVHQYYTTLVKETAFSHPSQRDTITVALALVLRTAIAVQRDNRPLEMEIIANELSIPPRFIREVAAILERKHIIATVLTSDNEEPAYLLSRCATSLSVSDVINACLDDTDGEAVDRRVEPTDALNALLTRFNATLTDAFNIPIATLLNRADPRSE